MKNIKLYEEFVFEAADPTHAGLVLLAQNLKSSGFVLDGEGKFTGGVPTLSKGDDSNGVTIQFKSKGKSGSTDRYSVFVTLGGKEKMKKEYPVTPQDQLGPSKIVQKILQDVEPWKKYVFPKTPYAG